MPNIFQEISKRIVETITFLTNKKLQFRDTGLYIQSSADGQLDIVADTTVAVSGAVTADSTLTVSGAVVQPGVTTTTVAAVGTTFAVADSAGFVTIDPGGAGSVVVCTLPAPTVGRRITFTQISAGTGEVQLASGTFDGSAGTATFNASAETLEVIGVATDRYAIIENIGTVQFLD